MGKSFRFKWILFVLPFAVPVFLYALSSIKWVGFRDVEVKVYVVEASSLKPVPQAMVEVLKGPVSVLEGLPSDVSEAFQSTGTETLPTDNRGRTQFEYQFFAAGSRSIFRKAGYVDTGGVWLRVTADGYQTTYLPVDRQSIRPRDIQDNTPIVVTIPVGKIRF